MPRFRVLKMFTTLQGHTFETSALSTKMVVVDAGANLGEFSRKLKALYGGQFFLIEANPSLAAQITQKNEFPVFNKALSSKSGPISFNISKNPTGSSILTLPEKSIWGSVLDHTITVESITLERFLQDNNLSTVDLLKLDIEGAEIDVLHDSPESILKQIRQITVEFHSAPEFGFDLKRRVEETMTRLAACGFIAMDFSAGTRKDVLFLNSAFFNISWIRRLLWRIRNSRPAWMMHLVNAIPTRWRSRLYSSDRS